MLECPEKAGINPFGIKKYSDTTEGVKNESPGLIEKGVKDPFDFLSFLRWVQKPWVGRGGRCSHPGSRAKTCG